MKKLDPPLKHGQYIRIAEYTLDEVLPFVVSRRIMSDLLERKVKKKAPEYIEKTQRNYDGHMVKMGSQRYQLFQSKGVTCVSCGLVGEFFGLEKAKHQEGDRYHFNLYGVRDGLDVLITKDHIIPKAKGGSNGLKNYQVMCLECNRDKADTIECS